jgi:Mor family transcriptional regulator
MPCGIHVNLTETDEKEICEMFLRGITVDNIARHYKCSRPKITKILKINQIDTSVKFKPAHNKLFFSENQIDEMVKLHDNGASMTEIGRKYNCCDGLIGQILRKRGINTNRDASFYTELKVKDNEDKIVELYVEKKVSINNIGKLFKVNGSKIKEVLLKNNVETKEYSALGDEREMELVNVYVNSTKTQEEISKIFNISSRTVLEILNKHKVTRRKSKHKYWEADRRSLYQKLIEKYGKEEAEIRYLEWKRKIKEGHQKKNLHTNPKIQVKPATSGFGISSRYNGLWFRSLTELTYFIVEIERKNLIYESAESSRFRIPYVFGGQKRNYYPDFFVDNSIIIEVKPLKRKLDGITLAKSEAAIQFCKNLGIEYRIVKYETDFTLIRELYSKKLIYDFSDKDKNRIEKAIFRGWCPESIERYKTQYE